MNSKMESQNMPVPDPSWDYYELWHMAYRVHEKLEQAIKYMVAIEKSDDSTDERLRQQFYELSVMCEECSYEAKGEIDEAFIDDLIEGD
ncbi:MAG: hypothetical protein HC836_19600 [Richelia sp. RM2_1_2]|nr:hypothetical protein [Richelia sp. RM1_1_1]NJO60390.1 hypothetical protein [Richelia sp. RM2_1_2]